MFFNSVLYLLFFASVYLVYWRLSGNPRKIFLIFASIVFYAVWGLNSEGWTGLRWTAHFILINTLNYYMIRAMFRWPGRKKQILVALLLLDLANLAFFKYYYFFLDIAGATGLTIPESLSTLNIFLPLAISFYTFILAAYAVDVYRGTITERVDPVRFGVFVLFFPHLIAGPIMRHSDFMHQIQNPVLTQERMYRGGWLIISGLIKKTVLADPMGIIIAPVFREPQAYDGLSILLAGMGFSLQVYSDFSGYTDMARGSACLLGYEIPENFVAPFFSKSSRELWQRWHITLASWLRDYIYIPLGGSRTSEGRVYMNLLITFTIGGLWHGADYTYIAWGAMWGFLLAIERFYDQRINIRLLPDNRAGNLIRISIMFLLFSIGAIMFRSQKVEYEDRSYTSGHIMTEMLSGILTNTENSFKREYAESGGDSTLLTDAFGEDIFQLKKIGRYDTMLFMFFGLFIFHMIQHRPKMLSGFRKYDPYLIVIAGMLLGYIIPLVATGSHQFIYFVF